MEELMAKYLADELDEKQRADFESQLIQDERFSLEFEAYMNAWALQDQPQTGSFDANSAWNTVKDKITETPVIEMKKTNFSFLKIAATLLILAVAGYFVITNGNVLDNPEKALVEHVSAASMEEFELPDGTKVKLNASSKLVYDKGFGTDNRNVTLLGQADFDVTRNEDLPFIITAGQSKIEVLGTSFDLAAYPGRAVKLFVTEGTVSFSSIVNEKESAVLTQGQRAVIDAEGQKIEVSEVLDLNFKGWWTRRLDFESTRLEEIFEVLETTYHVTIDYPEEIKDCPWTHQSGPDDTIEDVFETFDEVFETIKVEIKENQIKLEGTVCDK